MASNADCIHSLGFSAYGSRVDLQGAQGAPGAAVPLGAPGIAGSSAATGLTVAEEKIAALQSSNKKLSRNLNSLRRRVTKLMAAR